MIARRWMAAALALALSGCTHGKRHAPADAGPADAGPADAGAPIRTLHVEPLFPTSPRNLILNPAFFSDAGTSWFSYYPSDISSQPSMRERRFQSPVGVAPIMAFIADPQGTPGNSRRILLATEFVGGPGPFDASLWATYSDLQGSPLPLPSDPGAMQVTIAAAGYNPPVDSTAWDLQADPHPVIIEGRMWVHYQGTVPGPVDSQGLFLVRIGAGGGGWTLAAPTIIPTAIEDPSVPFAARISRRLPEKPPTLAGHRLDEEALQTFEALHAWRLRQHPPSRTRRISGWPVVAP